MLRLEKQKQGSFSLSSSSSWNRQIKVLMFLHVLVGFPVGQFDEVHEYTKKTVCYSKEREDKRLNTTVHRHVVAMSEFLCAVQCYHDSCCRSANFMKIPAQSDGRNNCELLHAIASKDSRNVVENNTYNHLVLVEPKKPFNCSCSTCKNNGSCQESSNECICLGGLTGERCEKDINECSGSNSCATNATCNNTVGSYTCECKKGFTGNGTSCTDIDECSSSNPCDTNAKCNNTFGSYTCECKKGFTGSGTFCTAKNCKELRQTDITQDGVYLIDPDGLGSFNVSCDMTTDEGGWTVFQRRMDGSVDFYLEWKEYKNGFGNISGEFWLGLDKIHRLTKNSETELRVDLEDFDGGKAFAKYKTFKVDAENEMYKLTVGNFTGRSACRVNTTNGECCIFPSKLDENTIYYSCITKDRKIPWCATTANYFRDKKWGNCSNPWPGDAGDSLTQHNGMKFSTKDKDNDVAHHGACAVFYKGAWWFKACGISNLNGEYYQAEQSPQPNRGVIWRTWKGREYSLKKTEMKIRPQNP